MADDRLACCRSAPAARQLTRPPLRLHIACGDRRQGAEARRIAVEWPALGCRIEELELVEAQDTLVDLSGLLARTYDFDHVTERRDDEHLDGLGKHRAADDDA
jgi:hypothetical protein